MNNKLKELTKDELMLVTGGADTNIFKDFNSTYEQHLYILDTDKPDSK